MLKEEIVVGKSYVNEAASVVCEVIEEVDGRHVKYIAFELQSRMMLPARHCVCTANDLKRWADREARPHERARTHPIDSTVRPDRLVSAEAEARRLDEARAAGDTMPGPNSLPKLI